MKSRKRVRRLTREMFAKTNGGFVNEPSKRTKKLLAKLPSYAKQT